MVPQKEFGGNPDVCSVYKYFFVLFMLENEELFTIRDECLNGERLCGECKSLLKERIIKFLKNHQEKREKARDIIDKYWVSEKFDIKELFDK